MNQQPLGTSQSHLIHVYTEEEQRLRWALIIEAILRDSGPSPPTVAHVASQPVAQPSKAT